VYKVQLIVLNLRELLTLTARQYGEVVLPDAATGQSIVPLGPGIVPVQGGYGALFAIMLQILLGSGAIAEQV
jgi:hypothetical protein